MRLSTLGDHEARLAYSDKLPSNSDVPRLHLFPIQQYDIDEVRRLSGRNYGLLALILRER
jgi:hypothetical protein